MSGIDSPPIPMKNVCGSLWSEDLIIGQNFSIKFDGQSEKVFPFSMEIVFTPSIDPGQC
jgi:hypothetical protein